MLTWRLELLTTVLLHEDEVTVTSVGFYVSDDDITS